MGLTPEEAKALVCAQRMGVNFQTMATIGRQFLLTPPDQLAKIFRRADLRPTGLEAFLAREHRFAEPFFNLLGAREIVSVDYSDYEAATVVHDFNEPIPESLRSRFDLVLDGGTLEHIFNFPMALKNCMEMVRLGGHLICLSPGNNALGHGFYQVSPELFFRVLSEDNGFRMEHVIAIEGTAGPWYRVADPKGAGMRIELMRTRRRVNLFVLAQRIRETPVLKTWPYQSDYSRMWQGPDAGPAATASGQSSRWRQRVVQAMESICPSILGWIRQYRSGDMKYHPQFFQLLNWYDLKTAPASSKATAPDPVRSEQS